MSIPAKRAGRKSPAVSISKKVYTMATVDGSYAEITMYGDIYEAVSYTHLTLPTTRSV